jgi:hypothetical protein
MQPQGTGPLNTAYFTSLTNEVNSAKSCADLQAAVTRAFNSINAFKSAISSQQSLLATLEALVTALGTLGSAYTTGDMLLPIFQQQYTAYASYASKLSALSSQISSLETAISNASAKFTNCTINIPT